MIWQVKNPASKKIMRNRMWANRREVSNNAMDQKIFQMLLDYFTQLLS